MGCAFFFETAHHGLGDAFSQMSEGQGSGELLDVVTWPW